MHHVFAFHADVFEAFENNILTNFILLLCEQVELSLVVFGHRLHLADFLIQINIINCKLIQSLIKFKFMFGTKIEKDTKAGPSPAEVFFKNQFKNGHMKHEEVEIDPDLMKKKEHDEDEKLTR